MAEEIITVQFHNRTSHPIHLPRVGMLTPGDNLEANKKTMSRKGLAMTLSDKQVQDLQQRGQIAWDKIADKEVKAAIKEGKTAPILQDVPPQPTTAGETPAPADAKPPAKPPAEKPEGDKAKEKPTE